jgi:hypothetical protein
MKRREFLAALALGTVACSKRSTDSGLPAPAEHADEGSSAVTAEAEVAKVVPDPLTPIDPVRKRSIDAAVAALGLQGWPLDPFIEAFGGRINEHLRLACPLAFGALRLETRSQGAGAVARAQAMMADVYEVPAESVELVSILARWAPDATLHLSAEEIHGKPEPRLRVGFAESRTSVQLFRVLQQLGLSEDLADEIDGVGGQLSIDKVDEIALVLDRPHAPPRIDITYPLLFGAERRTAIKGNIARVLRSRDVSEPTRVWFDAIFETLTSHDVNSAPVTVSATREKLLPKAHVSFRRVPIPLVLRFMEQFEDHPEGVGRMAAIAAAAGEEGDYVSAFSVTASDSSKPDLGFAFDLAG